MTRRNDQLIQSVERACLLIEAIGGDGHSGVRELAKTLGLGKSTVQRLAATLEQMGYLRQSTETAKYSLSLKFLELGTKALERFGLREVAVPVIRDLSRSTNESSHLAIWDRGMAVFIECVSPSHILHVYAQLGQRVPCHCSSVGKALLACRGQEGLDTALSLGLQEFTERTIVHPSDLLRELQEVRDKGFAINDEEHEIGLRAAAAPIRDHTGSAVAALGIAGPTQRIKQADLPALGRIARDAGLEISRHLGYNPRVGVGGS